MAFDSFHEFVQHLDRTGELLRISQPVATELADRGLPRLGTRVRGRLP